VQDHTAPEIVCGEVDENVVYDCAKLPELGCKAIDNCSREVILNVEEYITFDVNAKKCLLVRTLSAMDDCGNETTLEQTFMVTGDCCDKKGEKALEVNVAPNPFRDVCVISFSSVENGRAVLSLFDQNGRPVAELFNANVKDGQEVRVPFAADHVEMGVYQYRLVIGDQTTSGRVIVQ
jgi:hypothetical protein